MKFKRILTVCAVLALAAASAFADIAYIGQNNGNGQDWLGPLGMDFDVNSSINIFYMGVYNANALTNDSALASKLQVAIFNRLTGNIVAGTETTFQADYAGYTRFSGDTYDLFQSIPVVTLAPGEYSVVAVGFNGDQLNGNSGTGGAAPIEGIHGSISYVGRSRYAEALPDGSLFFPTVIDGGPANRYDAGTFAVPEPGFYNIFAVFVVFALGLTGLLANLRRRKNA